MNVILFGEAELGEYHVPMHIQTVEQLFTTLGNPPEESQGIPYAIQALLYKRDLYYIRVKEEGFNTMDYLRGFKKLKEIPRSMPSAYRALVMLKLSTQRGRCATCLSQPKKTSLTIC